MGTIKMVENIKLEDALQLCEWTNERGADFMDQWMGPRISYPLTPEKVLKLEGAYSIYDDNEFIGMVQNVMSENNDVHIGRFIINPEKTGQGFGFKAITELEKIIFADETIESISLNVLDRNKPALRLYNKLGFIITDTKEDGLKVHKMKKFRK
ncbi:MAG: GNAT family N-acetyltransferase [Clostridiaceae bacterium]